jgi:hypothetical protein
LGSKSCCAGKRSERIVDQSFAAGFEELVQQPIRALKRRRLGIVPRFLPPQKREHVAPFDAIDHRAQGQLAAAQLAVPRVQLRGIVRVLRPRGKFARPKVERGKQAVPEVLRVGIVERQGVVALEGPAQRAFPVIPILRPRVTLPKCSGDADWNEAG